MALPPRVSTDDVPPPLLTAFDCEPDEAALFHELAGLHGVAVATTSDPLGSSDAVTAELARCVSVAHTSEIREPQLRDLRSVGVAHLVTRSVGVDHIDLDAAHALGMTVDNVGYSPDGVADFTVMSILMALRHVDAAAAMTSSTERPRGRDLRGLTVGVLGVGSIGRAVIDRLAGFGCRVLACANRPVSGLDAHLVDLQELCASSDVLTLHVPLTSDTHHLIGRDQLESMPRGAVLVNTARGAVVDTGALVAALEDGRLGGAALDVVEDDPVAISRLRRLPNVTLTPHVAYRTERTLHETVAATLTTCMAYERTRTNDQTDHRDPVRWMLGGA